MVDILPEFPILLPDLQISFYLRLGEIRSRYLGEAMQRAIRNVDIQVLNGQLGEYVETEAIRKIASFGLRGELFFPVPYILETDPFLLGYYRLLYGLSRKDFYEKNRKTLRRFAILEDQGIMPNELKDLLPLLCRSLISTGNILVDAVDNLSASVIHDLQILTIGAQLRGGILNRIGQEAVKEIFNLIRNIVAPYLIKETRRSITVKNDSQRIVFIEFGNDPDISIREKLENNLIPKIAIEIKGGRDASNIYNRLGEANKSHKKAADSGFHQFWTIVRVDIDYEKARSQSPLTNRFFHLDHIVDNTTKDFREFRELFAAVIGIRANN